MAFSLSKRFIICATILFFAYTNAKLVVKYPPSLSEEFDKVNGIDYMVLTPQNKITYKRAFIGILTLAEPSNACEHIDSISDLGADSVYNPILLTTWGDCHYAQKVKNAEDAGAKMVLVVLQHEMAWDHPAVRSLTINTNVEVLAVSKADGDKLIEYIRQQKEQNKETAVELTYSYEIEKHVNYQNSDTVLIDFWFTSGDVRKDAYNFLENFHDVLAEFGSTVSFNPHYVLWECEGCTEDKRCSLDGRYCDPEPLIANKIPGKEAVDETLRQICFRELNLKTTVDGDWWKYVSAFGEQCVDKELDELKSCRDNILDSMDDKITTEVKKCVSEGQSQPMGGGSSHLSKELNLRDEMHIDHYPALYVNKEKYTGSLRNKNVMRDFLCSHFLQDTLPAPCVAAPIIAEQTYSGSDVGVYIALIIVSILVMALMIYCVRRSVKRQVMFRMNDEISHIVTQYKQFKDKSNSFSIDEDT